MKKIHSAILLAQVLSYALIISFICLNAQYGLIAAWSGNTSEVTYSTNTIIVACALVALTGVMNIWITFHYIQESQKKEELLLVCAWTHKVKYGDQWIPVEEFIDQQLGFRVTHGMSEETFDKLHADINARWNKG